MYFICLNECCRRYMHCDIEHQQITSNIHWRFHILTNSVNVEVHVNERRAEKGESKHSRGVYERAETNNDPFCFNHINLIWSECLCVLTHYIHLPPTELFIVFLSLSLCVCWWLSTRFLSFTLKLLNELSPDRVQTQSQNTIDR